jgi:phosphate transport system permease protein
VSSTQLGTEGPATVRRRGRRPRTARGGTSVLAAGTPLVWLTAGGLVLCLCMVLGLLAFVAWQGIATFWPRPLVLLRLSAGGAALGEVTSVEDYSPEAHAFEELPPELRAAAEATVRARGGVATRRMLRVGNFELTGQHYRLLNDFEVAGEERPEWALLVERLSSGRFYGLPRAFLVDGKVQASDPEAVWESYLREFPPAEARRAEQKRIERGANAEVNARIERARLALREV